jgi:glycosyltransferase involved in cell wall biosynthesis
MKLLVVSHSCATPINQQIYAELQRMTGWEITLVVPKDWKDEFGNVLKGESWPDFRGKVIPVPVFKNGSVILHTYKLNWRRFLRENRFDAIYMNHEPYGLATAQVAWANHRSIRVPFGFYSCQNLYKDYPIPFRWFERFVYRSSRFAFPITNAVAEVIRQKQFGGDITIAALPFDPALYFPRDASERPEPLRVAASDEVVIGYVGRIVEAKGLATLVAALELVKDLRWRLAVVGSGPYEQDFHAAAQKAGILDRFINCGYVPHTETPRYLAAFDFLVLPSETQPNWKEQFGRVITEALACGTPVIGSSSGEIPVLINQSGGGLVFQERDAQEFAKALRQFLCDAELRRTKANIGRTWALENISMPAVVSRMAETLEAGANTPVSGKHQ